MAVCLTNELTERTNGASRTNKGLGVRCGGGVPVTRWCLNEQRERVWGGTSECSTVVLRLRVWSLRFWREKAKMEFEGKNTETLTSLFLFQFLFFFFLISKGYAVRVFSLVSGYVLRVMWEVKLCASCRWVFEVLCPVISKSIISDLVFFNYI